MTEVVFAHEGTVAKVIGDAIQVLFNAPGDRPDHATRAVACVCELDAWAEEFRKRWKAKGVAFGLTRIGVHAGPALVGNFGGRGFFDYTAYGDTINTAARLCGGRFPGTPGRRPRAARAQRITASLRTALDRAFRRP